MDCSKQPQICQAHEYCDPHTRTCAKCVQLCDPLHGTNNECQHLCKHFNSGGNTEDVSTTSSVSDHTFTKLQNINAIGSPVIIASSCVVAASVILSVIAVFFAIKYCKRKSSRRKEATDKSEQFLWCPCQDNICHNLQEQCLLPAGLDKPVCNNHPGDFQKDSKEMLSLIESNNVNSISVACVTHDIPREENLAFSLENEHNSDDNTDTCENAPMNSNNQTTTKISKKYNMHDIKNESNWENVNRSQPSMENCKGTNIEDGLPSSSVSVIAQEMDRSRSEYVPTSNKESTEYNGVEHSHWDEPMSNNCTTPKEVFSGLSESIHQRRVMGANHIDINRSSYISGLRTDQNYFQHRRNETGERMTGYPANVHSYGHLQQENRPLLLEGAIAEPCENELQRIHSSTGVSLRNVDDTQDVDLDSLSFDLRSSEGSPIDQTNGIHTNIRGRSPSSHSAPPRDSNHWQTVMRMYDAVDGQMYRLSFVAGCMIGSESLHVYVRPRSDMDIEACHNRIVNIIPTGTDLLLVVEPESPVSINSLATNPSMMVGSYNTHISCAEHVQNVLGCGDKPPNRSAGT